MDLLPDAEFDEFDFMLQFGDPSATDLDHNVVEESNLPVPTDEFNEAPPIKRRRPRTLKPKETPSTRRRPRPKSNKSAESFNAFDYTELPYLFHQQDSLVLSNSGRAPPATLPAASISQPTTLPVELYPLTSPHTTITTSSHTILSREGTSSTTPSVTYNFVNGELILSKARVWTMVQDPASRRLLTRVPDSTLTEVQQAVTAAQVAFETWRDVTFVTRKSKILRLVQIVRQNMNTIAACICEEVGKTMDDATSEVLRAIDMIEAASSLPSGIVGSHLVNESTETHTVHEPLGVCMVVTPFNFPFLIPLWSIPFAVIAGNTAVLKPSEQCPTAAMLLADYFMRAEFPPGVLNIIHGGSGVVDKLLSQPTIRAVSFVGSDIAGERIHEHAVATRKRIQADCGSKNHGVIMEDAEMEQSLYAIAGSAFGAAGQRCMALSVVVFVGSTASWIERLIEIASSLKVGCGSIPGVDIGPLITIAAKERVESIIQSAVDEGALLLLDGRGISVPQYPQGNFVGPTVLSNVQPYMQCYQTEIFGPVLCCLAVNTLDEAIEIVNDNRYGNGCSIFTASPATAQLFQRKINVGQVGVNVPVLVTPGQLPRTSNKDSYLGDMNAHNQPGWQFFTQTKTITSLWRRPW